MHNIKGMIQVSGTTYRVVQREIEDYDVIRICDEVLVGVFACGNSVESIPLSIDAALMRTLAVTAVRHGRTSWMGPPAAPPSAPIALVLPVRTVPHWRTWMHRIQSLGDANVARAG